ncbi:hypothetical protein T12_289 [Trichinella patagoniensis]|uniref:Uncharacterized protein n=1 Tax=Trichinella patagoniensis TaxID=990121 RepID=A0A0V0Z9A3_9BILA|nr:hypothetical protein T12_289 [Trichinella patagoniensis]
MSRPRAATSVATNTFALPCLKFLNAFSRSYCSRSPCMLVDLKPLFNNSIDTISAIRLRETKINIFGISLRPSLVFRQSDTLHNILVGTAQDTDNFKNEIFTQKLTRQRLHFDRKRSGKHGRDELADRKRARYLADRRLEAHVQHSVSFVENEKSTEVQRHLLHLHELDETARGRDHDVTPSPQFAQLVLDAHAAVSHGTPKPCIDQQAPAHAEHLLGQFSSRNHHGRLGGYFPRHTFALFKKRNDRQQKGSGFAGARLRADHQISALQKYWNRVTLDKGRNRHLQFADVFQQNIAEAKFLE